MVTLTNGDRLSPETRRQLQQLVTELQVLGVTDLGGFTPGATTTFLREDGTFAEAGLTQAQVLTRLAFRG